MKQIRLLFIIGMLFVASTALADFPLQYGVSWTTEELSDSFLVTASIWNSHPDLQFTVYRDLLLPSGDDTPHYFTPEPIHAPANGEAVSISFNNLDMDPSLESVTVGRFVIEATWPDGSLYSRESILLTWAETYRLAKGYLVTDYLLNPCENIGLMECTTVELFYGQLEMFVNSPELLEFYGYILSYDGMDDCSLMISDIIPLGVGTPCEEPVANKDNSWDHLKATYR